MYKDLLDNALSEKCTPIVISIANWEYAELTLNWIAALKKLNINNYLIVSLDMELHEYLDSLNIKNVLVEIDNNITNIWKIKLNVSSLLVNNGINFIYSDVDAIWLKDPVRDYFSDNLSDEVVFSAGTIHPNHIYKAWGFTLCAGLFCIKSCRSTKDLFNMALKDFSNTNDDQTSLNNVIYNMNINWEFKSRENIYVKGLKKGLINSVVKTKIVNSESIIRGSSPDLNVSVLPYRKFPRTISSDFDPFVIHPISDKKAENKKKIFKENSLWFLDK